MDDGTTVLVIIAIGCGTSIVHNALITIRQSIMRRGNPANNALVDEIRALREEVQQLRQQNNDVILGLDSQARLTDRRLDNLESRALGPQHEASEPQVVVSRRG